MKKLSMLVLCLAIGTAYVFNVKGESEAKSLYDIESRASEGEAQAVGQWDKVCSASLGFLCGSGEFEGALNTCHTKTKEDAEVADVLKSVFNTLYENKVSIGWKKWEKSGEAFLESDVTIYPYRSFIVHLARRIGSGQDVKQSFEELFDVWTALSMSDVKDRSQLVKIKGVKRLTQICVRIAQDGGFNSPPKPVYLAQFKSLLEEPALKKAPGTQGVFKSMGHKAVEKGESKWKRIAKTGAKVLAGTVLAVGTVLFSKKVVDKFKQLKTKVNSTATKADTLLDDSGRVLGKVEDFVNDPLRLAKEAIKSVAKDASDGITENGGVVGLAKKACGLIKGWFSDESGDSGLKQKNFVLEKLPKKVENTEPKAVIKEVVTKEKKEATRTVKKQPVVETKPTDKKNIPVTPVKKVQKKKKRRKKKDEKKPVSIEMDEFQNGKPVNTSSVEKTGSNPNDIELQNVKIEKKETEPLVGLVVEELDESFPDRDMDESGERCNTNVQKAIENNQVEPGPENIKENAPTDNEIEEFFDAEKENDQLVQNLCNKKKQEVETQKIEKKNKTVQQTVEKPDDKKQKNETKTPGVSDVWNGVKKVIEKGYSDEVEKVKYVYKMGADIAQKAKTAYNVFSKVWDFGVGAYNKAKGFVDGVNEALDDKKIKMPMEQSLNLVKTVGIIN